ILFLYHIEAQAPPSRPQEIIIQPIQQIELVDKWNRFKVIQTSVLRGLQPNGEPYPLITVQFTKDKNLASFIVNPEVKDGYARMKVRFGPGKGGATGYLWFGIVDATFKQTKSFYPGMGPESVAYVGSTGNIQQNDLALEDNDTYK
ncbi:MAG: hypothetical protein EZS28_052439, partial [Streblomastix strix]